MNDVKKIFISSTFEDLKEEREKVIKTILKTNCFIPRGMEFFPATDEEQFSFIKKEIDDCDYYLLIIGGRYGSIPKNNDKSYTEKEYDYALSKHKIVFAFIHKDYTSLPVIKTDISKPKNAKKLNAFISKAKEARIVNEWTNADDLCTNVATSLLEEIIHPHTTETVSKPHKSVLPIIKKVSINGEIIRMIYVKGGTFIMGAQDDNKEADSDEKPAHKVTLSDYWIGETQVTQALWQVVMGENPSQYRDDLSRPVEKVSMYDCLRFIQKLNEVTGESFRLPTEAEWEFAARGGRYSKGYIYAGSNNIHDVACCIIDNCTPPISPAPIAVKLPMPNELGLYDMSGNVFEWCQDTYGNYSSKPQKNPVIMEDESLYIIRGGSWNISEMRCRVSYRHRYNPSIGRYHIGMRLALNHK